MYGVVSYVVCQRTREMGIRMALGANRWNVLALVVGDGMAIALAGVAGGIAGALALMRVVEGLLFGIWATDPLTYAVATVLLTLVAFLACWVPARRATGRDPVVSLRHQ